LKKINPTIYALAGIVMMLPYLFGCVADNTRTVTSGSVEAVQMRPISAPEILAESGKPKLMPAGYLKRRLRTGYPSLKAIVIGDRQYLYITEKWFNELIEWTEDFVRQQAPKIDPMRELPFDYQSVIAAIASNTANFAVAKRYNLQASVLIGVMAADSVESWGTIPADGKMREYLVALTEKGGIVYDVASRQRVSFEGFPNVDHMTGISF